ncbi:hypothetical protein [Xylella taiwanensis]
MRQIDRDLLKRFLEIECCDALVCPAEEHLAGDRIAAVFTSCVQ